MKSKQSVSISFLGDISFNDDYIKFYKEGINPFENIQPILESNDFNIGNLECMAKGEKGENLLKKPRLTTTVETLNYLKTLDVNIVSLAHNHAYDHLIDGFQKTTTFLKENNIKFLGASLEKKEVDKPIIIEKNGIKIGLLNYVTSDTNPNLPKEAKVFLNYFQLDKAIEDIKILKEKTNHVVLLLHWGGRVEGGLFPDWHQPKLAHKLIDAGADLIIGGHSHTIQPFEVYKGKHIFYSLGNFCFLDFIFEGENYTMPTRRKNTAIISVDFYKDNYIVDFDFFLNKKTYFKHIQYLPKLKFRNILFKIIFKSIYLWKIYYFNKSYILPFIFFINRKDITFSNKAARLTKSIVKRLK